MEYSISKISILSIDEIQSLNSHDIYTTDDLIAKVYSFDLRENLAVECNIDIQKMNSIVSIADLVRVKGLGIERATAIHTLFDIHTVRDFNVFASDESNVDEVCKSLKLSSKLFQKIAENASKINNHVFFNSINDNEINKNFLHNIESQRLIKKAFSRKYNKWILLFLVSAVSIIFIVEMINWWPKIKLMDENLNGQFGINDNYFSTIYFTLGGSLIIFGVAILFALWVYLRFVQGLPEFISQKFTLHWVFNSPYQKEAYLNYKLNKVTRSLTKMMLPATILVGVGMAIFVAIAFLVEYEMLFHYLYIPVIVLFVFLFFVVYKRNWKSWSQIKEPSAISTKKRLMFVSTIEMTLTLFLVIASFYLLFKPAYYGSIKTIVFINQRVAKANIEKLTYELNKNEIPVEGKVLCLEKANELNTRIITLFTEWLSLEESFKGTDFLKFISALSLVGILGLCISFLMPYIVLNGLRNTSLFLLAIMLSILLSEVLSRQSDTYFFIRSGSVGYYIFIFAMSLLVMAFVDTLYDIFSKRTICKNCKFEITDHVRFCPNCGISLQNNPVIPNQKIKGINSTEAPSTLNTQS